MDRLQSFMVRDHIDGLLEDARRQRLAAQGRRQPPARPNAPRNAAQAPGARPGPSARKADPCPDANPC